MARGAAMPETVLSGTGNDSCVCQAEKILGAISTLTQVLDDHECLLNMGIVEEGIWVNS